MLTIFCYRNDSYLRFEYVYSLSTKEYEGSVSTIIMYLLNYTLIKSRSNDSESYYTYQLSK